jgi:glucose-1-phosphate thymidylyltransferase
LARDWSAGHQVCVVLGDNILVGAGVDEHLRQAWHANRGASVFSCAVPDPRPYGVVVTASSGSIVDLIEKPADILADARAVPGLYVYDPQVFTAIAELSAGLGRQPDVTDVNRWYWTRGWLAVHPLGSDTAWCDAGTHDTLAQATRLVEHDEVRTGRPLACPDEVAWRHGWITDTQLRRRLAEMDAGFYAEHLQRILARGRSGVVTTS